MPKSAVPLNQSPQPTAQPVAQPRTGYMPKTAVPVQPEKKSVGGFISNLGTSAVRAASDIGKAITSPIQTGKSLYGLGSGLVSKFIPGRQQSEQNIDNLVSAYKEKYKDGLLNTLYNDPIGVALDASTVLGGAGAALRGVGAAGRVAGLSKAGSTLSKVGTAIDPLVATTKAIGAATRPLFSKIKPALLAKSEKMLTAGIGNPARQAKIEAKYGRSVPSLMEEYKLYDRSPETVKQAKIGVGQTIDEAATSSKAKIPVAQVLKSIDDKIAELQSGSGGVISDRTASQIEELSRRKQMFIDSVTPKPNTVKPVTRSIGSDPLAKDLQSFMDSNTTKTKTLADPLPEMQAAMSKKLTGGQPAVTPGQLREFRSKVIDPDVPKSEFGLNPTDMGRASGVKMARDIFRKEIIKAVPDMEKLGMDYGALTELEKVITDAASRASNRQLFNFTKLGSAGVGAFLGGIPGLIGGFVTEQVVNSPKFIEITSKMLRAVAESRGLTGTPGKLFSKTGSTGYLFGKTGRMATADQKEPISPKVEKLPQLPETYSPIIQPSAMPYKVPQIRRK